MRTDGRPPGRDGGTPHGCPSRPRRWALAAVVLFAGCRSNNKYDLIEAELRTRNRELLETRAELEQCRLLNQAYQRQGPPGVCAPGGTPAFHATSAGVPTLPLRDVQLGNGTGGFDEDDQPGDEALQVVLVPRDDDGTAIKVPGRLDVSAYEITREGLKVPIGRWEVTPDQLRRGWRNGLLSSGYFVPLQWDRLPTTPRVRVVARFTTLDGRDFEADKDVTVRPLPGACPAPATTPAPVIEPLPPDVTPRRPTPPAEVPADPTSRVRPPVEELPAPTPAARLRGPTAVP